MTKRRPILGTLSALALMLGMAAGVAAPPAAADDTPMTITVQTAPPLVDGGTDATVTFAVSEISLLTKLQVDVPAGWQVSPSEQLLAPGATTASVTVRAPFSGAAGTVEATLVSPGGDTADATASIELTPAMEDLPIEAVVAWDSAEPLESIPNPGSGYVSAAIDGDPSTFWHTQWDSFNKPHPHYIVLDLGSVQTVESFEYVPRTYSMCIMPNNANACNGQLVDYELYSGTGTFGERTSTELEGTSFDEPEDADYTLIAEGTMQSASTAPTTVTFDEPVSTRYLKLVALSSVPDNANGADQYPDGQPWTHAAELRAGTSATGEPAELEDVAPTAVVVATPSTAFPGDVITLSGGGFDAETTVDIAWGDAAATAETDAEGLFWAEVTVAPDAEAGVITFTITDGTSSATASVAVNTVPDTDAPSIIALTAQSGKVGQPLSIDVEATDESLPLVFSATGLPAGVSINGATGLIAGTPTADGSFDVTVTVTDAVGNSASAEFSLQVATADEPQPSPSPTPTEPDPTEPEPTAPTEFTRTAPYTLAGKHQLNDREWMTTCEEYSQTQRCRTEIWATIVVIEDGQFVRKSGWAFNNLTYLPFMTRDSWKGNPLGDLESTTDGEFTSAGRQWRTECDTAATGRGACRSYTMTTVYAATAKPEGGYVFSQNNDWVFNNIVMFGAPAWR